MPMNKGTLGVVLSMSDGLATNVCIVDAIILA